MSDDSSSDSGFAVIDDDTDTIVLPGAVGPAVSSRDVNLAEEEEEIEQELKRQLDLIDPNAPQKTVDFSIFRSKTRVTSNGQVDPDLMDRDQEAKFASIGGPQFLTPADVEQRERYLRKRVTDQREKLNAFAERNKALVQTVKKQKVDIESLKTDLLLAEQKAQRGMRQKLGGGAFDPSKEHAEIEKQKRRQLLAGEALVDDEDLDDKSGKGKRDLVLLRMRRAKKVLLRALMVFVPLVDEVSYMESHYGVGVAKFFSFFRWAVWMFMGLGLLAVPFLVIHLVYATIIGNWGSLVTPAFLLYSSYSSKEEAYLVSFIFVSIFILVIAAMIKFVVEDRYRRTAQLEEQAERQNRFSRLVFNCWDHSVFDRNQVEEMRLSVAENIRVILNEDLIGKAKRSRSRKEQAALYIRRFLGSFSVFVLVIGVWVLLITLTLLQDQIQSSADSSVSPLFSGFIVPGAVALVNGMFPGLVLIITDFEKWDDPTFTMKMQLFRLYALKIASIMIYMFTFFQLLSGINLQGSFANGSTETPSCVEDYVGNELIKLLWIIFFVDKVITLASIWFTRIHAMLRSSSSASSNRNNAQGNASSVAANALSLAASNLRKEYVLSVRTIDIVYFMSIVLGAFPFVPWIAIFASVLGYVNFKFEAWILKRFMRIPAKRTSAADLGVAFMSVYLVSFAATMVTFAFMFGVHVSTCGPFAGTNASGALTSYATSDSVSNVFYTIFTHPLILWAAICVLYVLATTRRHAAEVSSGFLILHQEKFERHMEHMETVIRKQARDINRLKKEASVDD